jgi:hypothetical protein
MSLQLAIPPRGALQQSSPPLHQLSAILKEKRKFEKEKPLNSKCANSKLSQQRGSPHGLCLARFSPTVAGKKRRTRIAPSGKDPYEVLLEA